MAYAGMAGGSGVKDHKLNLYYMPSPKDEHTVYFAELNGGLNVYDPPFA